MSEKLAIRSDRVDAWRKKKVNQVRPDLAPRKTESMRSSWAHSLGDSDDMAKVLSFRPEACRMFQALALFIFKEERNSSENVRFTIAGVSVHRVAFDSGDVFEDSVEHPVNGYDASHRSLETGTSQKLETYLAQILERELFEWWEYDRLELLSPLQFLIENGELREKYLPAAQRLLDRWNS